VRQPRGGQIPAEKLDLMNTVNQLLLEMNKLKGEKVALEEEVKVQRRSQVHNHATHTITSHDISLAASNKVSLLSLLTLVSLGGSLVSVDKI